MNARHKLVWYTFSGFLVVLGIVWVYHASFGKRGLNIHSATTLSIGSEGARVEMVLFQDFACFACYRFLKETLPQVQTAYLDSGKAHLTLIPVALRDESKLIATAILEIQAQEPSLVYPFIQKLVSSLQQRPPNFIDLLHAAVSLEKIQISDLTEALQSDKYDKQLRNNFKIAKKNMGGKLTTPALFINGERVSYLSFSSISLKIEGQGQSYVLRPIDIYSARGAPYYGSVLEKK